MAGLTPTEVVTMLATVRKLQREYCLTILIIEHVLQALMQLAARILVLHHGELIAQGTPDAIGNDERVLTCYVGGAPT
jgi:branched-chain amino acid transport system ATP-binding protein